jgi:hypothetical protein
MISGLQSYVGFFKYTSKSSQKNTFNSGSHVSLVNRYFQSFKYDHTHLLIACSNKKMIMSLKRRIIRIIENAIRKRRRKETQDLWR